MTHDLKRIIQILVWGVVGALALAVGLLIQHRLWNLEREDERVDRALERAAQTNQILREQILLLENRASFEALHGWVENSVAVLRGLPFRHAVAYRQLKREELRDYMLTKLRAQYSPEEFEHYERALKRLGLLPREVNLARMVMELYSEQVAAFYDPDSHELCTFEGLGLRNNFDRMVLAHELVHALQDQHFDFSTLALRAKSNDDAALAAAALVEGDASFYMMRYVQGDYRAGGVMGDLGMLFSQQTDKLFSAPVFLRDTLLFPYQEGQAFVNAVYEAGGQARLDAAYRHPPQSTTQILHPEKYLTGQVEAPVEVKVPGGLSSEWVLAHENTVGELGIRSLFSPLMGNERAGSVAAGWRGDRYEVREKGKDRHLLIWQTVWESEEDAREFFDALEALYQDRYGTSEGEKTGMRGVAGKRSPRAVSVFFSIASQRQNILLEGKNVTLLDVPDMAIMRQFFTRLKIRNSRFKVGK
ncbi:MAG: hypothetical protein PHV34_07020 [Verrucomicrobiae bacterium]|nr:hypothetical protein [Verrucomicrobiae bacterium]